ncbi:MAG: hypothetical protein C0504_17320 [Candidatus Solibacter sp.]|nr:hypothetical protein [Candidatus Solibacter sp.]
MDPAPKTRQNGPEPRHEGPNRLLSSWKEIADFLHVSPRTAQNYEKTRGLPVKRLGTRPTILEGDLRAWQLTSLHTARWWQRPGVLQVWAAASTALLIIAVAALGMFWRSAMARGALATARWNGPVLSAFDSGNRPVWSHTFPYRVLEDPDGHWPDPWLGDIDNDGKVEVLFIYPHVKREEEGWDLYCFSDRGKQKWSLRVSRLVEDGRSVYKPPYVVRGYSVFASPERDGTSWVAAAFVHHVASPSVLLVVDSMGKPRGEYWHPGHLNSVRTLDLDGDGIAEVIAGGVRHGEEQAALIVFDPREVSGAAHLPDQRGFKRMSPGTERSILFFPRSSINRRYEEFNCVDNIQIIDGLIQVTVNETVRPTYGYLVYTLRKDLSVLSLMPSVSLMNAHNVVAQSSGIQKWNASEEMTQLIKNVRLNRR